MNGESYELAENAAVTCDVIPEFYMLYCFAYYFNAHKHVYIYIKVARVGLMG